jgi:SH3-like domain-containing protein
MMRTLANSLSLTLLAATCALAEQQAYEARIVVARAQVRSGPGENFYPTGALRQGGTVEVYREQQGWLAIRPPDGSFSWVFGRHLVLAEEGLAEINKDDVQSRIGSQFSDKRNATQVRLRKGEVVEILGEDAVGEQTWYKIAPPAGEFRWIHASHVQYARSLPPPDATDEPAPAVAEVAPASEEMGDDAATPLERAPSEESTPTERAPETDPQTADLAPVDDWRAAASRSNSAGLSAPPLSPTAPPKNAKSAPQAAANTPASNPAAPADDLNRQVTELELRLSRMITEPTSEWNTETLARDAEDLLAQAQTPAERDAIKTILAKIDQFSAIAQRSQGQSQTPAATALANDALSPSGQHADYDAVGILRPVVSRRAGAPQFALVDERGQVITFVTPTPDVNLQPYLGRRVAVTGNRGFIPEFHRAHITAGRVAPLNERLLR